MIRYVFFAAILIFFTFTLYLAFSSAEAEAEAGDKNRLNNKKSYPSERIKNEMRKTEIANSNQ